MPTRLYRHTGETAVRIPEDPADPAIIEIVRPSRGTMIAASNEETIAALDARPDFEFVDEIIKDDKPGERPPEPHELGAVEAAAAEAEA